MMKLRIAPRTMSYCSNPNRTIPSHTLHFTHRHSLHQSSTHLPRRKQRMTNPNTPRQRGINVLRMSLPTHRTGNILLILPIHRNMKHWSDPIPPSNNNSIHRIRTPLRANVILGGNSNHKPTISSALPRKNTSRMSMRGVRRRQCNSNTILRIPLHPTIYRNSNSDRPPKWKDRSEEHTSELQSLRHLV